MTRILTLMVVVSCVVGFMHMTTAQPAPSASSIEETTQAIQGTLDPQEAAWNRGDIPGFMAGYVNSESLRFASGKNHFGSLSPTICTEIFSKIDSTITASWKLTKQSSLCVWSKSAWALAAKLNLSCC